jgi:hypothetical protein
MKNKKRVFFKSDAHYTITKKDKKGIKTFKINLGCADHISNTFQGEEIIKIIDDGNNVFINGVEFNYSQFEALTILLKDITKHDKTYFEEYFIK